MPDGGEALAVHIIDRIADLPAAEWDACAGADNPFVGHAFLACLEDSGSAIDETGWLPQHLVIKDAEGRLQAAAPLYLKSHSYGEYVFDWGWADAFERAGGRYYPKLQSSVPFTPVAGPRLLVRPDADRSAMQSALTAGLIEMSRRMGVSSLHVTFCEAEESALLGAAGFLQRRGLQYHWQNQDFANFDAFLASLVSRKRKAIKKERRKVAESGIVLKRLVGKAIQPRHWDAFYRFYRTNADHKWGQAYLTLEFFHLLGERLADQVLLVMAEDAGQPVGAALNLIGGDTLYGRNWGCQGHYQFLHFEACYYQAIEFAIEQGLTWVEAGAQGEHKLQRGYLPRETYSAHWIADPAFRDAIANFLNQESRVIDGNKAVLKDFNPFREA